MKTRQDYRNAAITRIAHNRDLIARYCTDRAIGVDTIRAACAAQIAIDEMRIAYYDALDRRDFATSRALCRAINVIYAIAREHAE